MQIGVRSADGDNGWDWFAKNPDAPLCSLGMAVKMSGMSAVQLRNAIDRGTIDFGQRTSNRRWLFSYRAVFRLSIIELLSSGIMMPVGAAIETSAVVATHFEQFVAEARLGALSQMAQERYSPSDALVTFKDQKPIVYFITATEGLVADDFSTPTYLDTNMAHVTFVPARLVVKLITEHVRMDQAVKDGSAALAELLDV